MSGNGRLALKMVGGWPQKLVEVGLAVDSQRWWEIGETPAVHPFVMYVGFISGKDGR